MTPQQTPFDGGAPQTLPQQQQQSHVELLEAIPPGSEGHGKLVDHLKKKITASERQIQNLHKSWERAENTYYAYLARSSKLAAVDEANNAGRSPEVKDIQVPHAFATVQTLTSYFMHVFCGAERTFTLKGYSQKDTAAAGNMEQILQIELEQSQYVDRFRQFFQDGLVYGIGVMKTMWDVKTHPRRETLPGGGVSRQDVPYAEGTVIENVDPYKFLPDPRVPVISVARKGEYVFWRERVHQFELDQAKEQGKVLWTDDIPAAGSDWGDDSNTGSRGRNRRQGLGINLDDTNDQELKHMIELHQGTIVLDPKEFGIEGHKSQKFMVTLANRQRVIQFEPYDAWHDQHPVVVCEPYSQTYEFASPGIVEYIADFQQLLSWFENSHIFNVRATASGTIIIDPSVINVQDAQNRSPGKMIRMNSSAQGHDIRKHVMHIPAPAATANHAEDLKILTHMADTVSGVTDVLRGNETNKEQTATEVNTKQTNASNRIAAIARAISSQAMSPLAEQMISNRQQYMQLPVQVDEQAQPQGAESLQGSFRFIVHDGTLPQARQQEMALMRDAFTAVLNSPDFSILYDGQKMFERIGELGNLDIKAYRRDPEKVKQLQQEAAQKPDPEMVKIQTELQQSREEHQAKMAEMQTKLQHDVMMGREKMRMEREKHIMDLQARIEELKAKEREIQMQIAADAQKHQQEMQQEQEKGVQEREQSGLTHLQQMEQQRQQGNQQLKQQKEQAKIKPTAGNPKDSKR